MISISLSKFLAQETSPPLITARILYFGCRSEPRTAFQKEDLFTVTLHWWVGRQTELSGRVLYLALSPWALCPPGAQVLGDREAPKRKQSEHRESEASERQAQNIQGRMASAN